MIGRQSDAKAKRLIAAVQTCRRKVSGLEDEEVWRDFLEATAGKRSLRAMTGPQLGRVLDRLHERGAPRTKGNAAGRPRFRDSDQVRMIRGLWLELHQLGAVRNTSEAAIAAFVARQTGQQLGALAPNDATAVIEALKSWRDRVGGAGETHGG